jgi:hypothetical protein
VAGFLNGLWDCIAEQKMGSSSRDTDTCACTSISCDCLCEYDIHRPTRQIFVSSSRCYFAAVFHGIGRIANHVESALVICSTALLIANQFIFALACPWHFLVVTHWYVLNIAKGTLLDCMVTLATLTAVVILTGSH